LELLIFISASSSKAIVSSNKRPFDCTAILNISLLNFYFSYLNKNKKSSPLNGKPNHCLVAEISCFIYTIICSPILIVEMMMVMDKFTSH
jgi:hypothetical protein